MSRFRDSLTLAIPHIIGVVAMIIALVLLPGKVDDWRHLALVIGPVILLIEVFTWLVPPFRDVRLRRMRAFLAKRRQTP